jgi:hypothetical protein
MISDGGSQASEFVGATLGLGIDSGLRVRDRVRLIRCRVWFRVRG